MKPRALKAVDAAHASTTVLRERGNEGEGGGEGGREEEKEKTDAEARVRGK